MNKRDKVIMWLEICIDGCNDSCPYKSNCESDGFIAPMKDALSLLKEQKRNDTYKDDNIDWSGAQGNDIDRIKEQAQRSEWGIY